MVAPFALHEKIANTSLFDGVFLASGYAEVLLTRDLDILLELLDLYNYHNLEIKLWHQLFEDASISITPEWHSSSWYENKISRLKDQASTIGINPETDTIIDFELYSDDIYDEARPYYYVDGGGDDRDEWLIASNAAIQEAIAIHGRVGYVAPHYNPDNVCYWTQLGDLGTNILSEAYYHLPDQIQLKTLSEGYLSDVDGYRLYNGTHPDDEDSVGYSVQKYILAREDSSRDNWGYIAWADMEEIANEIVAMDLLFRSTSSFTESNGNYIFELYLPEDYEETIELQNNSYIIKKNNGKVIWDFGSWQQHTFTCNDRDNSEKIIRYDDNQRYSVRWLENDPKTKLIVKLLPDLKTSSEKTKVTLEPPRATFTGTRIYNNGKREEWIDIFFDNYFEQDNDFQYSSTTEALVFEGSVKIKFESDYPLEEDVVKKTTGKYVYYGKTELRTSNKAEIKYTYSVKKPGIGRGIIYRGEFEIICFSEGINNNTMTLKAVNIYKNEVSSIYKVNIKIIN